MLLALCSLAIAPVQAIDASAALSSAPFELNVGAHAAEVAFRAPLQRGAVFVTTSGELVYALAASGGAAWSLVESWNGAAASPFGADETPVRVSRFCGEDERRWSADIPTFERVRLGELWPGVEVELRAQDSNVEKLFRIAPRARPADIQVRVSGACALRATEDGALAAETEAGTVLFSAPLAWQVRDGAREPVAVRYRVEDGAYGFELGPYDLARELWIDPLLQATYLGGSGWDEVDAMVYEPGSNSLFVAGTTQSQPFPGTAGGAIPAYAGNQDAYVARLSASLTTLQRVTYYGAASEDRGRGLAVGGGSVYLCGSTRSSGLPGAAGGAVPALLGQLDGFVARFDLGLTTLAAASYFGGTEPYGDDFCNDVAVDGTNGQVVVVGTTNATNLPGTLGSAEPAAHGGLDAYAARFSAALSTLVTASYVGGNQNDLGNAVVVQSGTGHVFVAGSTDSTDLSLAMGAGGAQTNFNNCGFCSDGFVVRFVPDLSFVEAASYFGDPSSGWIEDMAQAADSTIYVVGPTTSYYGAFTMPGLANGAQPYPGGEDDAFVARFAGDLQVVFSSTHIGGARTEWGYCVAIDPPSGDVLVGGYSNSWNLPAAQGGAQPLPFPYAAGSPPSDEAFVTRLSPGLNVFLQSTYYGGTGQDSARAVALLPASQVVIAGNTDSTNLWGVSGGAQTASGGARDGFLARFDATLTGPAHPPQSYCISGQSFNGCEASITATANPSATFANPCSLITTGAEGQKLGLIFYSAVGRAGIPWCSFGGSSYLCMLIPIQRLTPQSSGGTAGACDGVISNSWNAWHLANPAAPGNFLLPGDVIDAQCWYRDPGSCKNTSLSNAVEMTVVP